MDVSAVQFSCVSPDGTRYDSRTCTLNPLHKVHAVQILYTVEPSIRTPLKYGYLWTLSFSPSSLFGTFHEIHVHIKTFFLPNSARIREVPRYLHVCKCIHVHWENGSKVYVYRVLGRNQGTTLQKRIPHNQGQLMYFWLLYTMQLLGMTLE